jgi:hypothetical protein
MGNRMYLLCKGNQEEEHFTFLKHCTALAKRIQRLRQHGKEIEEKFGNNGEIGSFMQDPNFSTGLGHVLSGIMISSTLAWHLINKDSRFQFLHSFS